MVDPPRKGGGAEILAANEPQPVNPLLIRQADGLRAVIHVAPSNSKKRQNTWSKKAKPTRWLRWNHSLEWVGEAAETEGICCKAAGKPAHCARPAARP